MISVPNPRRAQLKHVYACVKLGVKQRVPAIVDRFAVAAFGPPDSSEIQHVRHKLKQDSCETKRLRRRGHWNNTVLQEIHVTGSWYNVKWLWYLHMLTLQASVPELWPLSSRNHWAKSDTTPGPEWKKLFPWCLEWLQHTHTRARAPVWRGL